MADDNKARILADGIEVWCSYDKLLKIDELQPHPKNPNTHPASQVSLLAQNIRYHGWRHPITVSKLSGYIVAGHGRLEAAKELGVSIVPVEYQDFASEDNELAVLVGDNRLAELSTMDTDSLKDIVEQFRNDDFDTIFAGYEETDLETLLDNVKEDEIQLPRDDRHTENTIASLKFGSRTIPMTEEEYDLFKSAMDSYIEENKTLFGFITKYFPANEN